MAALHPMTLDEAHQVVVLYTVRSQGTMAQYRRAQRVIAALTPAAR